MTSVIYHVVACESYISVRVSWSNHNLNPALCIGLKSKKNHTQNELQNYCFVYSSCECRPIMFFWRWIWYVQSAKLLRLAVLIIIIGNGINYWFIDLSNKQFPIEQLLPADLVEESVDLLEGVEMDQLFTKMQLIAIVRTIIRIVASS